jgi:oligopeptidase B
VIASPAAKRIPKIDVVHGDRRQDDYHWLRQKHDPDVLAHLAAENAYADAVMTPTEAIQDVLYREMLDRIREDDQTVPYRRGNHLYYSRTETGKQYPIHCRRAVDPAATEEVTLDLNVLAEGHRFLGLGAYVVSDDGHRLAYSLDYTGFREYTLYVKDLRTGRLEPDRIDRVTAVAWAADPSVLFYVTEDRAKRPHRLWRHALGGASDLVFEEPDDSFRLHVSRPRSRAFLVATSGSLTSTEVRCLPSAEPGGAWRLLAGREPDHEYYVEPGLDRFYIRTNGGGRRNFRLVSAPADDPRPERWTELLPHPEDVTVEDVDAFRDFLVVHERQEGLIRLRVTDPAAGNGHHVRFPEPAYELTAEPNPEFAAPCYRFRYQSLVTPASVYDYDVARRELVLLKRTEVRGGYDPTRYRSERVHATAADGTRVPISVVYQAGAPRDGSAPMYLSGYGSYGISYPVAFSSNRLSLLDRGVGVAIAHVRGGGELGKRWHDQGRMLAKRNTFDDFVAVAEFLVRQGYTAPDRLLIEGGSAGGLLIGAVLNARPDLCRAAILRVPFVDLINTMLDASLPLTVGEFEEWGNPKLPEHYAYMRAYCPYTNIRPQRYPPLLVKASLHDSQVMYWEPAKYVARLRDTKTDDNPILLKINMEAGHGGASGRYDALRELAFDYAFVLAQVGRAGSEAARAGLTVPPAAP